MTITEEAKINETILKIEEVTDDTSLITDESGSDIFDKTNGYAITTDKQVIKLLINNHQDCCEDWGYFMSEDDLSRFIGTQLLAISLTDTELNTTKHVEISNEWGLDGGVMFVNLETSEGVLQFVAYNAHNGYYGHTAYVVSEQLKHNERV